MGTTPENSSRALIVLHRVAVLHEHKEPSTYLPLRSKVKADQVIVEQLVIKDDVGVGQFNVGD